MSLTAECALRVMNLRRSFVFLSVSRQAVSLVSELALVSYWPAPGKPSAGRVWAPPAPRRPAPPPAARGRSPTWRGRTAASTYGCGVVRTVARAR